MKHGKEAENKKTRGIFFLLVKQRRKCDDVQMYTDTNRRK